MTTVDEWTMESEWAPESEGRADPAPIPGTGEDEVTTHEGDTGTAWSIAALLAREDEFGLAEWFDDWS